MADDRIGRAREVSLTNVVNAYIATNEPLPDPTLDLVVTLDGKVIGTEQVPVRYVEAGGVHGYSHLRPPSQHAIREAIMRIADTVKEY